jgi:K+-sensing histidine kinase KdpD
LANSIRLEVNIIDGNVTKNKFSFFSDLLDVTRISKNKLSLNLVPTNVHQQIENAYSNLENDKNIQLEIQLDATKFIIEGESRRLKQLFSNILKNAVKFTPEKGRICVTTKNDNFGNILIEIQDSGIGKEVSRNFLNFFKELQKMIFLTFLKLFKVVVKVFHFFHVLTFLGLGTELSLVNGLTKLMNGSISATSEGVGLGSKFVISFPITDSKIVESPKQSPMTSSQNILLVEDDKLSALVVERFLIKMGHGVKSANCIKEGISGN